MSDLFYKFIRSLGRPIVFGASRCLVLHEERARSPGGCLLAANHHSFYDSMVLVGTTSRLIDWVSIVELFQGPWQRRFMTGINCFALDRGQRDSVTTRQIIRRLRSGRMVGLFPEAQLRRGHSSVLYGGDFTAGVVRLAEISEVPIIPVVILGAGQFSNPQSWIPGANTFLAINYGEPIFLPSEVCHEAKRQERENALKLSFASLFSEIKAHADWKKYANGPWWKENYPN